MVGTDNSIYMYVQKRKNCGTLHVTLRHNMKNVMKNMFSRDMATPPGSDATRLTITLRDFSVI